MVHEIKRVDAEVRPRGPRWRVDLTRARQTTVTDLGGR